MVTLLAALEAGEITPGETIWCGGYARVSGRRFHCWKRGGHGWVDLRQSLRESCDLYYYELAQRAGIERMAGVARKLGLGVAHDLEMTSISEGLIPDKEWKRRRRGEEWVIGDSLNAAIGQGFVLASPLQLAVMTARLASGLEVRPRLVREVDGVARPSGVQGALDIPRSWLDLVRESLYEVVNSNRGTARRSRFEMAGAKWAGKTGTSQVRNITAAERRAGVFRNEDLPPGTGATTRCSWATRRMTTRATPSPSWWSMAAAGPRPRRRWRATSCSTPSTTARPPSRPTRPTSRRRPRNG